MNEDPIKSNFSVDVDTEDLKNQTKDAANQVKETIKNVNLGQDAKLTKGFVLEAIQRPFTVINNIVSEIENHFSVAVILMIAMMALEVIGYVLNVAFSKYLDFQFSRVLITAISPLLYILAFTVATTLFGGKEKKQLTTMLTGFIVAYVPRMLPIITGILYSMISISLVSWINSICISITSFIAVVLTFLVIKGTTTQSNNEDDNFKKVVLIASCAFVILKVLSIAGIY